MIIVYFAAIATQAPPQEIPKAPPIVVLPRGSIVEPKVPALSELSAAARDKVRAMDARAKETVNAGLQAKGKAVAQWEKALTANPFDARALTRAAAEIDAANGYRSIYANWAALFTTLSPADRRILAPHLASSYGRVFIDQALTAPRPPQNPYAGLQRSEREIAQNKAFYDFERSLLDSGPDAVMLSAIQEKQRLEEALPGIAHREPFDVAALKKAYGDLARAIGRHNARRSELVVEALAKLPPDKRALVMERIPYLAPPIMATPPPPRP